MLQNPPSAVDVVVVVVVMTVWDILVYLSNLWGTLQIKQDYFLFKAAHMGPMVETGDVCKL